MRRAPDDDDRMRVVRDDKMTDKTVTDQMGCAQADRDDQR